MIKTELIINKIGSMYQKYLNLLEINDETGVMVRFVDIQKFINQARTKLDEVINETMFSSRTKADKIFTTNKSLKPMEIDSVKILRLIGDLKFEQRDSRSNSKSQDMSNKSVAESYVKNAQKLKNKDSLHRKLPPLDPNSSLKSKKDNNLVKSINEMPKQLNLMSSLPETKSNKLLTVSQDIISQQKIVKKFKEPPKIEINHDPVSMHNLPKITDTSDSSLQRASGTFNEKATIVSKTNKQTKQVDFSPLPYEDSQKKHEKNIEIKLIPANDQIKVKMCIFEFRYSIRRQTSQIMKISLKSKTILIGRLM